MAEYTIDKFTYDGNTYKLQDNISGYNAYTLPIASASTLGGIKVGTGLTIDSSTGILNATGTSMTIDTALSATSTNPVQNKVITEALDSMGIGVGVDFSDDELGLTLTTNNGVVKFNNYLATDTTPGFMSASDKSKLDMIGNTWYGTCSTTASTAAKVVTCSNFSLVQGATISILFSTANTAATPTLNVNSTGAKSIYIGTSTPNATTNVLKWSENTLITFIYDGTYFRFISAQAAGSAEQPRGANIWYGTCSTAAGTAAKTSTINNFVLTKGATVILQMTTDNTVITSAITLNINSTGAKKIYKENKATSATNQLPWKTGETLIFTYDGSYWRYVADRPFGSFEKIETNYIQNSSAQTTTFTASDPYSKIILQQGNNIHLTPDSTTNTITISATDTDTKNTAGATTTSSQIYLIGATATTTNPQTYTNSSLLYDNGLCSFALYYDSLTNDYSYSTALTQTGQVINLYNNDLHNDTYNTVSVSPTSINITANNPSSSVIIESPNNGTYIHNVVTPTANADAVNKEYIDKRINFSDTDDQMWVNWYREETAIYGQQTQSVTYSFAIHMDDNKTKLTSATLARSYNGTDWNILGTLHPTSSFSNSFVPIGTILDFAGSTAPSGYLICDGRAVSRTTYSDLFAIIGTTWGVGDGSTTFNLPNLCGRTTIGVGTITDSSSNTATYSIATVSGEIKHTLTASESGVAEHNHEDTLTFKLPNHAHGLANSMIVYNNASSNSNRMATSGSGTKISVNTNVGLNTENPTSLSNCTKSGSVTKHNGADATTSHNNMQPYATVNKIIKAI